MGLKNYLKFIIPVIILYVFFYFIKIGCPIKFITGISCAGCGMTRAWYQVLFLHFDTAFYYHPLFWIVPLFIIFLYCFNRGFISKKMFNYIIIFTTMVFAIVYIYRLFDPNDTIVEIDLSNSALAHSFKILAERRK